MANPFVHVELQTQNLEKAKAFYQALFTWKLEDVPALNYTMISVGEGTGGGMMKSPAPNAPARWLAYVLVDDVKASTQKARRLGGTVLQEVSEVPNHGWFSVISDPTGAVLALWQQREPR